MKTMRWRMLIVGWIVASALPAPAAECNAPGGAPRPHLVELYTSEGCSSCPPADAWLRRMPAGATALEFHVDYWDSLGWADRFADARFTRRQEEQAHRDGGGGIYTPQVVLDGRSWSGWYRGGDLAAAPRGAASMRLDLTHDSTAHVRLTTAFDTAGAGVDFRNYVALTEDGLSSQVRAGENRGELLRHDHVVRTFAGPLPLSDATVDLRLPDDADPARMTLVAFAQRSADGAVAQVITCPLASAD
jgi:hypothetical protein